MFKGKLNLCMAFVLSAVTVLTSPFAALAAQKEETADKAVSAEEEENEHRQDVFKVVLPTNVDHTFDFIMDPQELIQMTDAQAYEGKQFEEGATLFFRRMDEEADEDYSSSSDALTIVNKGSMDVDVCLTASIASDSIAGISLSDDDQFSDTLVPSLYLALTDGENTVPISSDGEAVIETTIEGVSRGEEAYQEYSFQLTGAVNKEGDWSELADISPEVTVTWVVSPSEEGSEYEEEPKLDGELEEPEGEEAVEKPEGTEEVVKKEELEVNGDLEEKNPGNEGEMLPGEIKEPEDEKKIEEVPGKEDGADSGAVLENGSTGSAGTGEAGDHTGNSDAGEEKDSTGSSVNGEDNGKTEVSGDETETGGMENPDVGTENDGAGNPDGGTENDGAGNPGGGTEDDGAGSPDGGTENDGAGNPGGGTENDGVKNPDTGENDGAGNQTSEKDDTAENESSSNQDGSKTGVGDGTVNEGGNADGEESTNAGGNTDGDKTADSDGDFEAGKAEDAAANEHTGE